jgi:hypothetical protein
MSSIPFLLDFMRRFGLRRPTLAGGAVDAESKLAGHPLPQVPVRREGASCLLDDLLGYRFSLVVRDARLAAEATEWARERDIGVWHLGEDFVESSADAAVGLSRWMRDGALDFALARPDRHLFAVGRASELPRARAAFERWFRLNVERQRGTSPSAS